MLREGSDCLEERGGAGGGGGGVRGDGKAVVSGEVGDSRKTNVHSVRVTSKRDRMRPRFRFCYVGWWFAFPG